MEHTIPKVKSRCHSLWSDGPHPFISRVSWAPGVCQDLQKVLSAEWNLLHGIITSGTLRLIWYYPLLLLVFINEQGVCTSRMLFNSVCVCVCGHSWMFNNLSPVPSPCDRPLGEPRDSRIRTIQSLSWEINPSGAKTYVWCYWWVTVCGNGLHLVRAQRRRFLTLLSWVKGERRFQLVTQDQVEMLYG